MLRVLMIGLMLALAQLAVAAESAPSWASLTADQQNVLRPLQARWNELPQIQRARLIGAAKRYPTLSSSQQQRFSARLKAWASLTLEQREQARAAYRRYSRLPDAQRAKVRERWFAQHPKSEVAEIGTAPAQ